MAVSRRSLHNGVLAALGFGLGTAVVTGLLPTPVFDRMVERALLDYVLLGTSSLLLGVYVVQRAETPDCGGDGCAYGGAAGGFLAVACPHCNAILVSLFGASWLATYVDPIRPLVGVLAVVLLAAIVIRRRRS